MSSTAFVGEHTSLADKMWVGVVPFSIVKALDPVRYPGSEDDEAGCAVLCHSGPVPDEPGVIHTPSFPTNHVDQMFAPWAGGAGTCCSATAA